MSGTILPRKSLSTFYQILVLHALDPLTRADLKVQRRNPKVHLSAGAGALDTGRGLSLLDAKAELLLVYRRGASSAASRPSRNQSGASSVSSLTLAASLLLWGTPCPSP